MIIKMKKIYRVYNFFTMFIFMQILRNHGDCKKKLFENLYIYK